MNKKILINEFNNIKSKGWIKPEDQGYGSAGLLFESLLGINTNNLSYCDYFGIEIKTKYSKKEDYITLFSLNPTSDKNYTIKYLVDNYGYPDQKNPNRKVFQTNINSVYYKKHRKYNFKLSINIQEEKLYLNIYNKENKLIDNTIHWKLDNIKEKLKDKCELLAFIQAESRFDKGKKEIRYLNLQIYEYNNFKNFISSIELGYIRVCFKIGIHRTGKLKGELYNHGTSFQIKVQNINKIFNRIY